jgi:uncharacterized membrane protein
MTRTGQWMVIAAAAILGVAYAVITPPFEVPDEVSHFWRSLVIANGQILPQRRGEPDAGAIPLGAQNLVFVMSQTAGGKYTREQVRVAAQSAPELGRPKVVRFPSPYTPMVYAPQVAAAIAMRLFALRPFVAFYLGRLAALATALALMAIAMRAAPAHAAAIAAVILLPTSLSQLASWSADAMTMGFAVLLTALLLAAIERPGPATRREAAAIAAVALALGLCKPAYFLISLLALAIPRARFASRRHRLASVGLVLIATALGTAAAMQNARLAAYVQRIGSPIDAGAQLRCILLDPLRFARVLAHDLASHGAMYVEQMVGRFGATLQVDLPAGARVLAIATLIVAGLSGAPLRAGARIVGAVIVAATVLGILFSTFLGNSIACGEAIEGVQGRYWLPILPLALTIIAPPRAVLRRVAAALIVPAAVIANAVALVRIVRHFW